MLTSKIKLYLMVLLLLFCVYGAYYTESTTFAGADNSRNTNSIRKVSDSNITDAGVAKGRTSGQDGSLVEDDAQAGQRNVQRDSNRAARGVVDQNAVQQPATTTGKKEETQSPWVTGPMIAIYIVIGLGVGIIIAWILLRKTLRTRLGMKKIMTEDSDIDEFLIAFNWTPKILYFPTMIASIVAANLMYLQEREIWFFASINPEIIGGVWFVIFFLNFLVEEYNITIMVIIISFLGIGFLLLWLNLVGWVSGFLKLFRHFALSISSSGYLLVSVIGLLTILISWVKGLFYYVTITPNYMNLQEGPTETGEQIGREDYNTRVDTSNFFSRLLGFGKIVITFKDKKRQPIVLQVGRIKSKAQLLEKIRAKFVIDRKVRKAVEPEPEMQNPA